MLVIKFLNIDNAAYLKRKVFNIKKKVNQYINQKKTRFAF